MNWFPAWQVIGLLPLTTSKSCSSKREITWKLCTVLLPLLLALGWTVWKTSVFFAVKNGVHLVTHISGGCKICPWPLPQERVAHAYLSLKNRVCQRSGYNNDSSSDSSDLVHSHGNSVKKKSWFFLFLDGVFGTKNPSKFWASKLWSAWSQLLPLHVVHQLETKEPSLTGLTSIGEESSESAPLDFTGKVAYSKHQHLYSPCKILLWNDLEYLNSAFIFHIWERYIKVAHGLHRAGTSSVFLHHLFIHIIHRRSTD